MQPTMQPALKFVDINPSCINALQQAFPDVPGVTYEICGMNQAAVGCRRPACIADAGNSFGMMDVWSSMLQEALHSAQPAASQPHVFCRAALMVTLPSC